jgi:hypothetical protein
MYLSIFSKKQIKLDEEVGRFTLIQKVSWKELKKFIINEVNKYTTNLIKK